jgi:prolyl oligopeptidase
MKAYLLLLLPILLPALYHNVQAQNVIPETRRQAVTDEYFGTKVIDHYRWLEDVNKQEVKNWFKTQAEYARRMIDQIPGRDSLIATLVSYDKLQPVRYGYVKRRAGRYFFRKTLPGENVSRLYYKDGEKGPEKLILDPEKYARDKKYTITDYIPSEDGKMIAIALSSGGAEISTLRIFNIASRLFLKDSIGPVREEFAWTPDNRGIIYTRLNSADPFDPNFQVNTASRYHVLGTDPANDPALLSSMKYPGLGISKTEVPVVRFSTNHQYLIGNLTTVDLRTHLVIAPAADLLKGTISWKPLVTREDSITKTITIGPNLYLQSIKGAPNGRVIKTALANPNIKAAQVVVPEGKKIYEINESKNCVLITKDDVVRSYLQTYDVNTGKIADVNPPVSGIYAFGAYDPTANDCFILTISWLQPATAYDFNTQLKNIKTSAFNSAVTYPGIANLEVEEIEIPGHDGTMIPLTIMHRKDLKKDGSSVCFMTGYGAYGFSATPRFDTKYLALLNQGVVVAVTHPRGGSEKGLGWYKAGFKTTKPNTWKDFISSGEYLIKSGYTTAGHLIGEGTSAGGILIGRAITERPDLFAAAINNVGATNILRFELTPNADNIAEFGTFKDSVEFKGLLAMDALSHVREGVKYPAVINVGGMNDPRVIVWQPGKFAAALQHSSSSGKPVLMQVNYDNGHSTEDKTVAFRNFANMYAFALWQAGHPAFQVK